MDVNGTAAIVTGGASGLGAATAKALAAAGGRVAVFDIDQRAGHEMAAQTGGVYAHVDVADEYSIARGLEVAHQAHAVSRILVNCAGVTTLAQTVEADGAAHNSDILRRAINVNLLGSFYALTQFAARLARAEPVGEERGVIVNTASIAAYDGASGLAAYAASKGGIVGMTLPAARDLAKHLIRVTTIAPGMFQTPMVGNLSEDAQEALGKTVPFPNRLGKPEEFAHMVVSIITNPMVNGAVIRLDGAHRLPAGH